MHAENSHTMLHTYMLACLLCGFVCNMNVFVAQMVVCVRVLNALTGTAPG